MAAQFLLGWIRPPGRMELAGSGSSDLCISLALKFNCLLARVMTRELKSLFNSSPPAESILHPSPVK